MSNARARTRPTATAVAAALIAIYVLGAPAARAQDPAPTPQSGPKVLVLGFDGLAADRVERLDSEGKLPHLAALRARGGYARLATSNPAQSPVAWASILSGGNPGKTGISDFLRRPGNDPRKLTFAHVEVDYEHADLSEMERALLVAAGAVLGAVLGLGIAFALGARDRRWRKGKRMEILLSGGAALGAALVFGTLRWVPETRPFATSLRSGEPFWMTLDAANQRTIALEAPLCFPPDPMNCGCCLPGLGVPDMAGGWGTFAVWTDDAAVPAKTETAGLGMFVDGSSEEPTLTFDLVIGGPKNALLDPSVVADMDAAANVEKGKRDISFAATKSDRRLSETREQLMRLRRNLTATLTATIERGRGATVTLQNGTGVSLKPGEWTDLLPVSFAMSPLVTMKGRVRLHLEDAGSVAPRSPFRLFVSPVQWDAADVPRVVQLSEPRAFAAELAGDVGPFETIGWPELTNPVKDALLSDRAFLDHTYLLMKGREAKLRSRLKRGDYRLLFALFAEPDRVQHALYRHVDPESPLYDPKGAAEFGGEIDKIYIEADRIVGEAMALAGPDTEIFVVSDHGFAPFRRGVNIQTFLRMNGYQTIDGEDTPGDVANVGGKEFFTNVDWARTKAYGFGLGGIYLNLAGREPKGSVPLTDADAVLDGIIKGLMELKDEDGTKVVRRVYRGSELFKGKRAGEAPDLVVGFEWGYRVSWQSCVGGSSEAVITPNMQRWSGDHCSVDPELVPGVFFSSRPLAKGAAPRVEDVAPTLLSLYGLIAPDADGKNVLAR